MHLCEEVHSDTILRQLQKIVPSLKLILSLLRLPHRTPPHCNFYQCQQELFQTRWRKVRSVHQHKVSFISYLVSSKHTKRKSTYSTTVNKSTKRKSSPNYKVSLKTQGNSWNNPISANMSTPGAIKTINSQTLRLRIEK